MKKIIWKIIRTTRTDFIFLKLASVSNFFRKFIPRHYYYGSIKKSFVRNNVRYLLDISDYTQWKIYSYNRTCGASLASRFLNKRSSVVLDIGSNVGEFSLGLTSEFLKRPNDDLTVYTFEPNPIIFDCFVANVDFNKFPKRIKIHPFNIAVGDSRSTLKLNVNPSHSGSSSLLDQGAGNLNVDIWPLDEFFKKHPISALDFVKIDVECFEPFVLKGGTELLKKYMPVIYLEHNVKCNQKHALGEDFIYNFLISKGYHLAIECDDKMQPINDFDSLRSMGKVDILAIPPGFEEFAQSR